MKRALRIIAAVVVALVVVAYLFHTAILAAIGGYLVKEQAPEKVDIAIVLAGDATGKRILKAAEMVRQGYAPQVLVSGPGGAYGMHECDLAIPFAVKQGYPEAYFRHMEHDGLSTRDEAEAAAPILRQLHAHTVMLVTNDYHTRRAGNVFRDVTPDISYIVVGAPDGHFSPRGWWHDREGRKIALLEWAKTVGNWFRM